VKRFGAMTRARCLALAAMLSMASTVVTDAVAQAPAEITPPATDDAVGEEVTPTGGVAYDAATAGDTMRATMHYRSGVSANKAGDKRKALAEFRKSYGVVRSPNSRLLIVRMLVEMGRDLEGYREALELVEEADGAAAEDAAKYQATADAAREELASVRSRIALVTVIVPSGTPAGSVVVNGVALDPADWGRPVPMEAGELVAVLTTADGEVTKTAAAAGGGEVEISLAPAATGQNAPSQPSEPEDGGGYKGPDRVMLAVIAGGVGALGILNFGIFGMLANERFARLETGCEPDPRHCDRSLEQLAEDGDDFQTLANVSLALGALGFSAGAAFILWDTLDDDGAGDAAGSTRPVVTLGPGTVTISGRF